MPSRTTSSSSISWTSAPSKLPKIASGFFQQATRMNWLDDKTIFNWGRADDSDMADDVFFFLDKFYSGFSGRSRSGSVSESDSRSHSRNRSRTNSHSGSISGGSSSNLALDGFKVEGMTSLPQQPPAIVISQDDAKKTEPIIAKNISTRRIFRIDDVDEEEEEDEEDVRNLAVANNTYQEADTKKDV